MERRWAWSGGESQPRAMAVRFRGKPVPDVLISGSNYAAWAVVSALLAWIILGG